MIESIVGTYVVDSQDALQLLAGRVADSVEAGDILLLVGDLGSGKTAFVQALAQVLQVGERVTSPTFTVAQEYDVPHNHVLNQLVHVDLYRLGDNEQGKIGVEEQQILGEMFMMAQQLQRLIVVEWANKLPQLRQGSAGQATEGSMGDEHWKKQAWWMNFEYGKTPTERLITIEKVQA